MTLAWFDVSAGASGDMLLGALVDAGAPLADVQAAVDAMGVEPVRLSSRRVRRGALAATKVDVEVAEVAAQRAWRDIRELLAAAPLPPPVRDRATDAFARLARAEGAAHGVDPDDVHFHEVGALDAIVDVVGTCAALEVLGVDEVGCSPVATGHGTVAAAHGRLPVPAPATVRLLEGLPVVGVDVGVELATPTGAALVRTLSSTVGAMPAMTVTASGYGAGGRDLGDRPNVVQAVLGTAPGEGVESLVLLETNVDDVTGEVLAHAIARLLGAGALDAWATPIVMKKGRPAHTVAALAHPAEAPAVAAVLAAETGTLGVRASTVERRAASRTEAVVHVDGHAVGVKVVAGRVKAEFDDAAAAAAALGVPVREVLARAEAAHREEGR